VSAVTLVPDAEDRATLVRVSERAIASVLSGQRVELPDVGACGSDALTRPAAVFVTLERDDELLGCVGTLVAERPLLRAAAAYAVKAAFADPRLPSVTPGDYVRMSIKVSVLSPLEDLGVDDYDSLRDAVRPDVDGLVVEAGRRAATFLPSVWGQLPEVDDFLDALWRKAGLTPRSWPDGTSVRRYRADEITGEGPRPLPRAA
jgi:AmmeMemoRadiSam system protein A